MHDCKCDKCDRRATHHAVELVNGKKIEKHLCDIHAAEEGLAVKSMHSTMDQLLTNFVKLHSGSAVVTTKDVICDACGLTFSEFQERSLLGCPRCYASFEALLTPLLERAHEGGAHHLGKVPHHADAGEERQQQLLHMRKRLSEAVVAEDYELAAHLRDELGRLERGTA